MDANTEILLDNLRSQSEWKKICTTLGDFSNHVAVHFVKKGEKRGMDVRHGKVTFTIDDLCMAHAQLVAHEIAHIAQLSDADFENGVVTWGGMDIPSMSILAALVVFGERGSERAFKRGYIEMDEKIQRELEVLMYDQVIFGTDGRVGPARRFCISAWPSYLKEIPTREEAIARFWKNWNRIQALAPAEDSNYVPWYAR